MALPPPLPCRAEILLFLEIFFRSLPCQGSNRPAIVGVPRFSGRYAEKGRRTKASIVRLGAVRAHSVKIGPDMHCCRTARPMRDLQSLPFHYRSGAMRTELGDQQKFDRGLLNSQSDFISMLCRRLCLLSLCNRLYFEVSNTRHRCPRKDVTGMGNDCMEAARSAAPDYSTYSDIKSSLAFTLHNSD